MDSGTVGSREFFSFRVDNVGYLMFCFIGKILTDCTIVPSRPLYISLLFKRL